MAEKKETLKTSQDDYDPPFLRVSSLLALYQRLYESWYPELEDRKTHLPDPFHSDTTHTAAHETSPWSSIPIRTCSLLSSTASVVLLAPGLAAFQNCFWAE